MQIFLLLFLVPLSLPFLAFRYERAHLVLFPFQKNNETQEIIVTITLVSTCYQLFLIVS